MVGWIAKKLQNSRVYMCIKETKWEIENEHDRRKAIISAIAHGLRVQMLSEIPDALDILDRPTNHPRDQLMQLYGELETVKIISEKQKNTLNKSMRNIGSALPEFATQHMKDCNRALTVWMSTLGAGITPERGDDVRDIWRNLFDSQPLIPAAIDHLRTVEAQTALMTGSDSEFMFGEIDDVEWISVCSYVPSIFKDKIE